MMPDARLTLPRFKIFLSYFLGMTFTPLKSPSIYTGDGENRKHQLLIEGGVKALPFLTGFTLYGQSDDEGGALSLFALYFDLPTMIFNNSVTDRKS
jgi:hypothetical protein